MLPLPSVCLHVFLFTLRVFCVSSVCVPSVSMVEFPLGKRFYAPPPNDKSKFFEKAAWRVSYFERFLFVIYISSDHLVFQNVLLL